MSEAKFTVALTGATGFVGGHMLRQLLAQGCQVRALVRDATRLKFSDSRLTPVHGDLFEDGALRRLVADAGKPVDAVIHTVGIIMQKPGRGQTFDRVHVQGTKRLLAAAQAAGVTRWVHMSALGSRPDALSDYHRTKWLAEQAVRGSGLRCTIFRPSIIHGPDGEFMQMVKDFWCKPFPPFVPYFGAGVLGRGGAGKLQPVWVEDVARCFVSSLDNIRSEGEVYPLGGPEEYTWPRLYETCREYLPGARKKKILAVPVWYAKALTKLLGPALPFNRDQVLMSQEDSTCDINKAQGDFGFEFAAFEPTFAEYAKEI